MSDNNYKSSDNSDNSDDKSNFYSNCDNKTNIYKNLDKYPEQNQLILKKRGRPKKNTFIDNNKIQIHKNIIKNKEEDIILHLPNDTSDNSTDDENSNVASLLTLSETVMPIEKNIQYMPSNKLLKELKKKDEIIEKLNNFIEELKTINNTKLNEEKKMQISKYPDNIKLIDIKDGKTIISNKTNIVCWWDTCNFDTIPWFIPDRLYDNTFYVFGCFCSPNCALAYNINMNDYKIHIRTSLLKQLYKSICNNSKANIIPSFQPELLEKYGGNMTIEEYRNKNILLTKDIKIAIPPIVQIISNIKETIKNNDKN